MKFGWSLFHMYHTERFLTRVDFLMLNKASIPSETSLTFITFIRHSSLNVFPLAFLPPLTLPALSRVRILKVLLPWILWCLRRWEFRLKALPHVALVGLLPVWILWCSKEAAALAKCFPTVITLVGLLPSVSSLVFDKVWTVTEDLATFFIHMASHQCELSDEWREQSFQWRSCHSPHIHRVSPQCGFSLCLVSPELWAKSLFSTFMAIVPPVSCGSFLLSLVTCPPVHQLLHKRESGQWLHPGGVVSAQAPVLDDPHLEAALWSSVAPHHLNNKRPATVSYVLPQRKALWWVPGRQELQRPGYGKDEDVSIRIQMGIKENRDAWGRETWEWEWGCWKKGTTWERRDWREGGEKYWRLCWGYTQRL